MIDHVEFIGIREAENTQSGILGDTTINSTEYSILVFSTDGGVELVEGSASQIRPYLRYVKPASDTEALKKSIQTIAEQLKNQQVKLEELVERKITQVFDSLHHLPEVQNMGEGEAIRTLKAQGFDVELLHEYPEGTPEGIAIGCTRKKEAYMTAVLDIRHPLPEVAGLNKQEAIAALEINGFRFRLEEILSAEESGEKVLACIRDDEISMNVTLKVSRSIPDLTGMPKEKAAACLNQCGMTVSYKQVMSDQQADTVISWSQLQNKTIELSISAGKRNLTCKRIGIGILRGTSPEVQVASAKGTATLDRGTGRIVIQMDMVMYSTHKLSWINQIDIKTLSPVIKRCRFSKGESEIQNLVQVELTSDDYKLPNPSPTELNFTLHAQYGTLRQTTLDFPFNMHFDWS